MQRINTAYFYRLATKLIPLRNIEAGKQILDYYAELYGADEELRVFLGNMLMPPVTCRVAGEQLLQSVTKLLGSMLPSPPDPQNPQEPQWPIVQWNDAQEVVEALQRFEVVLQSDFAIRDTFILSPKAAYSTTLLAENGETLVSDSAHELVPSMKKDLHDAGRCMAFELPTAAAFHLFRAVEAMVSAYAEYVRGQAFTFAEKKNGLGGYANSLKEKKLKVDERIITSIEQLARLHRNPTMHPEIHISNTEVRATVGMVVSVIETVALDWNRRKTTPDTSLAELLPDDSKVLELTDGTADAANKQVQP